MCYQIFGFRAHEFLNKKKKTLILGNLIIWKQDVRCMTSVIFCSTNRWTAENGKYHENPWILIRGLPTYPCQHQLQRCYDPKIITVYDGVSAYENYEIFCLKCKLAWITKCRRIKRVVGFSPPLVLRTGKACTNFNIIQRLWGLNVQKCK